MAYQAVQAQLPFLSEEQPFTTLDAPAPSHQFFPSPAMSSTSPQLDFGSPCTTNPFAMPATPASGSYPAHFNFQFGAQPETPSGYLEAPVPRRSQSTGPLLSSKRKEPRQTSMHEHLRAVKPGAHAFAATMMPATPSNKVMPPTPSSSSPHAFLRGTPTGIPIPKAAPAPRGRPPKKAKLAEEKVRAIIDALRSAGDAYDTVEFQAQFDTDKADLSLKLRAINRSHSLDHLDTAVRVLAGDRASAAVSLQSFEAMLEAVQAHATGMPLPDTPLTSGHSRMSGSISSMSSLSAPPLRRAHSDFATTSFSTPTPTMARTYSATAFPELQQSLPPPSSGRSRASSPRKSAIRKARLSVDERATTPPQSVSGTTMVASDDIMATPDARKAKRLGAFFRNADSAPLRTADVKDASGKTVARFLTSTRFLIDALGEEQAQKAIASAKDPLARSEGSQSSPSAHSAPTMDALESPTTPPASARRPVVEIITPKTQHARYDRVQAWLERPEDDEDEVKPQLASRKRCIDDEDDAAASLARSIGPLKRSRADRPSFDRPLCICSRPAVDSAIECDSCHVAFHVACVSIPTREQLASEWHCPRCVDGLASVPLLTASCSSVSSHTSPTHPLTPSSMPVLTKEPTFVDTRDDLHNSTFYRQQAPDMMLAADLMHAPAREASVSPQIWRSRGRMASYGKLDGAFEMPQQQPQPSSSASAWLDEDVTIQVDDDSFQWPGGNLGSTPSRGISSSLNFGLPFGSPSRSRQFSGVWGVHTRMPSFSQDASAYRSRSRMPESGRMPSFMGDNAPEGNFHAYPLPNMAHTFDADDHESTMMARHASAPAKDLAPAFGGGAPMLARTASGLGIGYDHHERHFTPDMNTADMSL